MSYGELIDQVASVGEALARSAIGRTDRVALVVSNGPDAATAFLGIAAAAACAPLNPTYLEEELRFYLGDLRPKAIVVERGSASPAAAVAAELGIEVLDLEPGAVVAGSSVVRPVGEPVVRPGAGTPSDPDDVALLLHTSGTTARPKLVPLRHGQLVASARNIAAGLDLSPGDRCLNVMPLFHIHGIVGALLATLVSGGSVACAPGFLAPRFLDWLAGLDPTWYTAVPTIHQGVLQRADALAQRADQDGQVVRHRLRFIRSSSASLPAATAAGLERAFGVPVIEAYGMTEAAHQMASNPLPPDPRKVGSVGPAAGPRVAILDEVGRVLPTGAVGEVAVSGPTIFGGYDAAPEANERAFVDGWFRTGDQGSLDEDGYLFLRGRLKEIINRGGEKISPLEVDEVLTRHPAVLQAVTFAVPDPRLGEEVGSVVVLRAGASTTEAALQAFVAGQLAAFKVPRVVSIVDDLPKGPTGKVQRIGLAERLGVRIARKPGRAEGEPPVAPRTELERDLVAIWSDVLGVDDIGVRDDFFDLGGDSMLAAQLLTRVRDLSDQHDLPLATMLWAPTIEQMAVGLSTGEWAAAGSLLVPIQPGGHRPPFFFVHLSDEVIGAATLRRSLDPEQPVYGLRAFGDGAPSIPPSVRELADVFETEIRTVQGEGPYYLGGYCSGARVAIEIAERMVSKGDPVGLLALVDPRVDRRRSPMHFLRRIPHHLRHGSLREATIQTLRLPFDRLRPRRRDEPVTLDRYLDDLARARAGDAPRRYPGTLTILATEDYRDVRSTWEAMAGEVAWHDLPVPHETAFQGDNATAFGARIDALLAQAQAGDGRADGNGS
jgi:acyl-CoA synthetase (AMP-forming)/AMP-acid ligase II/thioesterase domain-containing protein